MARVSWPRLDGWRKEGEKGERGRGREGGERERGDGRGRRGGEMDEGKGRLREGREGSHGDKMRGNYLKKKKRPLLSGSV